MSKDVIPATLGIALFAGLVLALAVLILPGCGLRLGPLGDLDFCAPARTLSASLGKELERLAVLEARLRGLERRLAELPACRLPPPSELLPDPDVLDAEKWDNRDVSVLEGCWALASDYELQDVDTGEVSSVETWTMCFDVQGNGDQHLVMTDGLQCTAESHASFVDDGRLRISDLDDVDCSGEFVIFRRVMECELEPEGEAACISRQTGRVGYSELRITNRVSP